MQTQYPQWVDPKSFTTTSVQHIEHIESQDSLMIADVSDFNDFLKNLLGDPFVNKDENISISKLVKKLSKKISDLKIPEKFKPNLFSDTFVSNNYSEPDSSHTFNVEFPFIPTDSQLNPFESLVELMDNTYVPDNYFTISGKAVISTSLIEHYDFFSVTTKDDFCLLVEIDPLLIDAVRIDYSLEESPYCAITIEKRIPF